MKSKTVGNVNFRVEQPSRREFVSVILSNKQATTVVQKSSSETENLLVQARKLYQDGSNDEAMGVLRRILVSEPMSAESYLILGMIHLRQGEMDQATSSLKTALFWDNRLILANVNLRQDIFCRKAIVCRRKIIRGLPSNSNLKTKKRSVYNVKSRDVANSVTLFLILSDDSILRDVQTSVLSKRRFYGALAGFFGIFQTDSEVLWHAKCNMTKRLA